MGAFASCDATWASDQLSASVPQKLSNLTGLRYMADNAKCHAARQGQLLLLRHCANSAPSHWLRLMSPASTARAALLHDNMIDAALTDILCCPCASPDQLRRAISQARLPLSDFGGLGLTSASAIRHAAYVGRFASTWASTRALFPSLRHLDLATSSLASVVALRHSLDHLHRCLDTVESHYSSWDRAPHDYSTFGDKKFQFHPPGVAPRNRHDKSPTLRARLPSLSDFADPEPDSKLTKRAQSKFSAVTHHSCWLDHYRAYRADHRATTVFVCASQPHAGDFLRAIPTDPSTAISSAQLLVLLQRRLALPLHPVPTPPHDPYGDSLQNEGCHTFRHDLVKERWYDAFTDTFGASLSDLDPRDGSHESYSPGYRPERPT